MLFWPIHVPDLMTGMSASSAALASQKRGLREVAIRRPMVGDRPRIWVQCKVGSPRTLGWGKSHAEDSERIAVQSSNNRPAPTQRRAYLSGERALSRDSTTQREADIPPAVPHERDARCAQASQTTRRAGGKVGPHWTVFTGDERKR